MPNRHSRLSRSILSLIMLALGACSDSSPTAPAVSDGLSSADARDLALVLASLGTVGGTISTGTASAHTALASASLQSASDEAACPEGGVAKVEETQPAAGENVAVTVYFTNCRVRSESGTLWTLNGAPALRMGVAVTSTTTGSDDAIDVAFSMKGAIKFSNGKQTGSCTVDMLTTAHAVVGPAPSITMHVSGSMCGEQINAIASH